MSSDAALYAATDYERGTMCQAMLPPCVQLCRCLFEARHHEPGDAAAMRAAIGFEARHPVPRDAALHAAPDTKRGTMCQVVLLPCVQLLIRSEAPRAKRRCIACRN